MKRRPLFGWSNLLLGLSNPVAPEKSMPAQVRIRPCGMTQCEIASALGISQARVQQIEHSALRKLRDNPNAQRLLTLVRFEPANVLVSE